MPHKKFRPHQSEAWDFITNQRSAGLALFMEMRLGKTLVFIRWAKQRMAGRRGGHALVVAPSSVIDPPDGWLDQLRDEGIEARHLHGSSAQKVKQFELGLAEDVAWFVTNPEGVRASKHLQDFPWNLVCCDESTYISHPRSQTTKVFLRKFRDVDHKAVLAGEPCPEGAEAYFTQLAFAHGEFMGCKSFWPWRLKYYQRAAFGWELKSGARKKIRDAVREVAFQKTAKQAGLFIPKVYEVRYVDPSPSIKKLIKQVSKDFALKESETKWTLVCQTWLAMLAGGIVPEAYDPDKLYYSDHKLKEVERLVVGEMKHQQIIVWCRFTREIKHVAARLRKLKVKVVVMRGAMSIEERSRAVKDFRAGRARVIVCQQRCGRYGLNFSNADVHLVYSNEWSWLTRAQMLARGDHMDKVQEAPTLVVDLVSRGTPDEEVVIALKSKKQSRGYFLQRVMARCRAREII